MLSVLSLIIVVLVQEDPVWLPEKRYNFGDNMKRTFTKKPRHVLVRNNPVRCEKTEGISS
jgi:hypothetical protein